MAKKKKVVQPQTVKRETSSSINKVYEALKTEYPTETTVEFLPTGSVVLDTLWYGGLPRGRITELAGPPGTGKSTLACYTCAYNCQQGKKALYLGVELAMTDSLLAGTGCLQHKGTSFFFHKINTYADLQKMCRDYILDSKDPPDILVIDAIPALTLARAAEVDIENSGAIGLKSRACQMFLEHWKYELHIKNVAVILVNHMRTKMGGSGKYFNASIGAWGGFSLKHMVDISAWLDIVEEIRRVKANENTAIGNDLKITMKKIKVGVPKVGYLSVLFGKGPSNARSLVTYLIRNKLAQQKKGTAMFTISQELDSGTPQVMGPAGIEKWIIDNFDHVLSFVGERGLICES